ncbi:MAG: hypothetical protein MRY83_01130 [Flavobacteriales bacterium]|nr:hypothetical protein [Flavobacteriales bacterium]
MKKGYSTSIGVATKIFAIGGFFIIGTYMSSFKLKLDQETVLASYIFGSLLILGGVFLYIKSNMAFSKIFDILQGQIIMMRNDRVIKKIPFHSIETIHLESKLIETKFSSFPNQRIVLNLKNGKTKLLFILPKEASSQSFEKTYEYANAMLKAIHDATGISITKDNYAKV